MKRELTPIFLEIPTDLFIAMYNKSSCNRVLTADIDVIVEDTGLQRYYLFPSAKREEIKKSDWFQGRKFIPKMILGTFKKDSK